MLMRGTARNNRVLLLGHRDSNHGNQRLRHHIAKRLNFDYII